MTHRHTASRFLIAARLLLTALLAACATLVHATRLALDISLDPVARTLVGHATLAFSGKGATAFSLAANATIERATVDGAKVTLERVVHDGRALYRAPAAVHGHTIAVNYRIELAPLAEDRDHRGVLGALAAMAGERGSFLPSGTGWYPEPDGEFSYTVTASVPASQRAIVPGRLVRESIEGGRYRASFEYREPAAGIDLMAGPYEVRERRARIGSRDLRLRTYFHPELGAVLSGDYLGAVERYLELYSDWIGPYPFDGFSVVSSPLPTGFGMPALTYLGVKVLKLPFIRDTSLGHEVLHNWWGNSVYPDYAEGNWAEGLTTFMADYAYKERTSATAARDMRLAWLRDYASLPAGDEKPLVAFTSRTHSASAAVGYGKAAMLFYMVRERIGRDAFDRAIRAFYREHRFKRASWADLEAAFSKQAQQSLAPMFAQWLDRTGAPRIDASGAHATRSGSNYRLEITLTQDPPPYSLDIPLVVRTAEGMETFRVPLSKPAEVVALTTRVKPITLAVDPNFQLWRRLAPGESPPILREAIAARAPVVVLPGAVEPSFRAAAESLAGALLEHEPQFVDKLPADAAVALVMGPPASIDALLADGGLGERPAEVGNEGTAEVWTVRKGTQTIVLISARDADALAALARALPHLGSQSWAVFEGARPTGRGTWPIETYEVPVQVDAG